MRKLLVVTLLLVGESLCSEPNRDTTQVCVELQGRMAPTPQDRENCALAMSPDNIGRKQNGPEPYQPYPGMFPPQGPQMKAMNPQMAMAQSMTQPGLPMSQPGMYIHRIRSRAGLPPIMPPPHEHIFLIRQLEDELAARDREIAKLKNLIDEKKNNKESKSESSEEKPKN